METKDLGKGMEDNYIWEGNYLAKVLAEHNKGYSEYYFKNLILKAWYAGVIRGKSKSNSGHNYWLLNPEKILEWARSKGLRLPPEFSAKELICEDEPECDDFYSTELHIANEVHRAIISQRESQVSFKQQSMALLDKQYPFLSDEAKERIAVLINPDKSKKGGAPKKQNNSALAD